LLKLYVLLFYMLQAIQKGNSHSVLLENLQKDFRRPRRILEEKFKNGVGERACKLMDPIICLA